MGMTVRMEQTDEMVVTVRMVPMERLDMMERMAKTVMTEKTAMTVIPLTRLPWSMALMVPRRNGLNPFTEDRGDRRDIQPMRLP
jgi:hypothetical protein